MSPFPAGWSPDGSQLLAIDFRNEHRHLDACSRLETGEAARAHAARGRGGVYVPGPWAPDGSGFYLLTDEGREFLGARVLRLAPARYEWVETPEGDVDEVALSGDGRVLAWIVNEDGWSAPAPRPGVRGRPPRAASCRPVHGLGHRVDVAHALSRDGPLRGRRLGGAAASAPRSA